MILFGIVFEGGEGVGMDWLELFVIYMDGEMLMSEKFKWLFFLVMFVGQMVVVVFVDCFVVCIVEFDLLVGFEVVFVQLQVMIVWVNWSGDVVGKLGWIKQLVFVINGNDDCMIFIVNSFVFVQGLLNVMLIVYLDLGYGVLFQYVSVYVVYVVEFLCGV